MKLTDRHVAAFPLSESRKQFSDDAVSGLSVRVGKSGKTFQLVIGTGESRKRFTLGTYDPPRFTLAMAREKARDIIARERLQPQSETLPKTTFEDALEIYYRVHLPTLRYRSELFKRRTLDRHFRPAL